MLWTLLLVAPILYFIYDFYRGIAKLPKGPTPLPFLGNILKEIHPPYFNRDLEQLAKKFGSVFTFCIPFPVVNISNFEALRTALKGDEMTDRVDSELSNLIYLKKNGGIVGSSGESWREQRRFAISVLRDFGMGKGLMEDKVHSSTVEYLRFLRSSPDLNAIDMHTPIQLLVANIINEFLYGYRYSYDNCEKLLEFVNNLTEVFRFLGKSKIFMLIMRFPWLKNVPFLRKHGYDPNVALLENLRGYVVGDVEESKKSYNEEEEASCYVHAYVRHGKSNAEMRSAEQLYDCCSDLFVAGQETTTTTLRWAMLLLADNQKAQDKIRAEIFSVVGKGRLPSMADKANMPYTSAAINEVQRKANIIPLNFLLLHKTSANVVVDGVSIHAGTPINADYHQVHNSDPHFVNPERFWPERYLAKDGVTLKKDLVERTIPFGIGKRQCAGEGLARMELFIGITATLQNYRVLPSDSSSLDLVPETTAVMLPKAHKLKLVYINQELEYWANDVLCALLIYLIEPRCMTLLIRSAYETGFEEKGQTAIQDVLKEQMLEENGRNVQMC